MSKSHESNCPMYHIQFNLWLIEFSDNRLLLANDCILSFAILNLNKNSNSIHRLDLVNLSSCHFAPFAHRRH